MSSGNYSQIDLHDWNISYERFREIMLKCNYKIDESKVKISTLLKNQLVNMLNTTAFHIQYVKREKLPPELIKELSIKEKVQFEKLLSIGIAQAIKLNILEKEQKRNRKKKRYKLAIIKFLLYIHAKMRKRMHYHAELDKNTELKTDGNLEHKKKEGMLHKFNLLKTQRREFVNQHSEEEKPGVKPFFKK